MAHSVRNWGIVYLESPLICIRTGLVDSCLHVPTEALIFLPGHLFLSFSAIFSNVITLCLSYLLFIKNERVKTKPSKLYGLKLLSSRWVSHKPVGWQGLARNSLSLFHTASIRLEGMVLVSESSLISRAEMGGDYLELSIRASICGFFVWL